ncbi:MAG: hypothetical protein ACKPKO_58690, partial [Candidatus Fonsibacter sp.]
MNKNTPTRLKTSQLVVSDCIGKMAPKKQKQSGSFAPPKRGESASSSSGPQTDTIRFRVHNGAMKKEMNLVAPITVEELIMYIVANPKPFHGNITKERARILTMDNVELPLNHEFENDFYKLHTLTLRLAGPPPKKESAVAKKAEPLNKVTDT